MGRPVLLHLSAQHKNDAYDRGQAERTNQARGYQLHLEALARRHKAGVDRDCWRMVRLP